MKDLTENSFFFFFFLQEKNMETKNFEIKI